ncbi:MAG TPA: tetratricopeptide repeat protein [Opitutaceae bacterium]|jgi:predicted O-linked N-acetylglucosamine transferase (SPINDLY family)|nr:tetratricopeptide repeat protein [Opitutaceae bacterium]
MISTHLAETLRKAVALQRDGQPKQAAACYALACAAAPADPNCGLAYAALLIELGRNAEAEACLRPLAALHRRNAELWDLWSVALQLCGKPAESIRASEGAVAANPRLTRAWVNLALAYLNAGRPLDSLAAQEKALAIDRRCASALHGRAMALQHLHRIPEAVEAYGEALARDPNNFQTRSYRLFALHYLSDVTREQLWTEHQAFGRQAGAEPAGRPAGDRPGRRLRLAFLSPDLREHSISYFLEPLLAHLDRDAFEVVLYHDHYHVDHVSRRLQARASLWRNFVGLSHEVVARQIRDDRIDVLVDLAGHTGLNRQPMLARRVAPVQISYLGYPDTTGVAAMDFRLVDPLTDPPGEADRTSSERLVRFAPALWAFRPAPDAGAPGPARTGPPVFGSCNNLSKVSEETLRGWAGILAAVPGSLLRLKSDGLDQAPVAEHFRKRAAAAGIEPGRLELRGRAPTTAKHLAFYQEIDVALDTFPYHGTTTTCEALWMGVPVISLAGDRHCARVGVSLLSAVGRPGWIAGDWNAYIRLAAAAAADRPDRAQVRRSVSESVLMDHAGQAARFGAAVRECWTRDLRDNAQAA